MNDITTHRSKEPTFQSPLDMTITDFAKTDAEQIEQMLSYLTQKYNKALTSLAKEAHAHLATKSRLQEVAEERI